MDITEFCESLKQARPPQGLNPALEALWWEAKGDSKREWDSIVNWLLRTSSH